jgi:hypothetical protein
MFLKSIIYREDAKDAKIKLVLGTGYWEFGNWGI